MKRQVWVLTLFPDFYTPFLSTGVVGQLFQGKRGEQMVALNTVYLGDYSPKGFKGVDHPPYGGGPGMVLRADVLHQALLQGVVEKGGYGKNWREKIEVILPSPRGVSWKSSLAKTLWDGDKKRDLVFIAGRYQGVDQRFIDFFVEKEISLGDYILSNGDIAVLVILDSTLRLLPSTVGNDQSVAEESFSEGLLEHPLYTRPANFEGMEVPPVLRSGDHQAIANYQRQERERVTREYRPDLYKLLTKQNP